MANEVNRDTVLAALSSHIGSQNGIKARDLVVEITWKAPSDAQCRTLRHVIELLRREGNHIAADPHHGYFIARTNEELNDTCTFLYNRAMTSLTQIGAMKRIAMPDIAGQLRIDV